MGSVVLEAANCLRFLDSLEPESVDLALYDPPYFMGNKPFINKKKRYERLTADWDNQWKTVEDYLSWCKSWLLSTSRILKPGGTILVFGSTHTVFRVHTLMCDLSGADVHDYDQEYSSDVPLYTFRNFIPWHVTNAPPFVFAKAEGIYAMSNQYINYFTKGKRAAYFDYNYLKELAGGVQHRDLFQHPQERSSERLGHPTQKPISFIRQLVHAHCAPDGVVVDCFSGSGTTAAACVAEGRSFVGCDIDPKYAIMGIQRVLKQGATSGRVFEKTSIRSDQDSGTAFSGTYR